MVEEEEEDEDNVEKAMIYRVDPELVSEVLQLGDLLLSGTHGGAGVCLKYQGLQSRECRSCSKMPEGRRTPECQSCSKMPEKAKEYFTVRDYHLCPRVPENASVVVENIRVTRECQRVAESGRVTESGREWHMSAEFQRVAGSSSGPSTRV